MTSQKPTLASRVLAAAHQPAAQAAPLSATVAPASSFNAALLSEDEAAAWFGISKRTFQSLRHAAWMPSPIVLGPRLLRWSVDELRAAVTKMPRQTERAQPESLLRTRIERAKATGDLR
jgi:predicted DNA-binding transcriptional regulator AlpA